MAWLMSNTQTEEIDEFEMAQRSPKKRSSSPSKRLMRGARAALSKVMTKRKEAAPQALIFFDEDEEVTYSRGGHGRSARRCDGEDQDEYIESSDCVLLDGFVDMYLGGQHCRRRSAEYTVRYMKAENVENWPANLDDSCSSADTFRSVSTTSTTSGMSNSGTSSRSTKRSL